MTNKPIRILLDMDGVLVDFKQMYIELNGITPKEGYADPTKKAEYWNNFVLSKGFEKAKPLPDAWVLIDFLTQRMLDRTIKDIEICSSAGGAEHYDDVKAQKLRWLAANELDDLIPNIVVNGYKKHKVINKDFRDILIDDTDVIVDNFIKNGGEAILHTSAYETIMKLDELFGYK